jgi:hypothetical protein
MPRISAFYGIVITMYWRDHPPAHFHSSYAGHVAKIEIESLLDVAADRRAGIARVVRDELHRRGG